MKKNMGTADKVLRILLAVVLTGLFVTGVIKGTVGIVLIAVSIIFLLTGLMRFCPVYALFGWKTNK